MNSPEREQADDAQYQQFRDLAAELDAEGDEKALERGVKRLGKALRPPKATRRKVRAAR